MRDYRILILGGYGRAGYEIADVLLGHTTAILTLAGRHIDQAEAAATELNRTHPGDRVSGAAVNMTHPRAIACCSVAITVNGFGPLRSGRDW